MAQIDLRNVDITLIDGYDGPGTVNFQVNNALGYTTGATTMTVDTGVGAVETGNVFTVVGDTVEHTITAHSETSGNTTSITFTPALGANVADNASITIFSHEVIVRIGQGTCTYSEKRAVTYTLDRGEIFEVKLGDDAPVDVKLDFVWEELTAVGGSGTPTIEDALKQRGEASNWVSSDVDEPCRPYSVDIVLFNQPPCTGVDFEKVTLNFFRWESLDHDLKNGTVSVSGKCNIAYATVERIAA